MAQFKQAQGKPSRLSDAWRRKRDGFVARHMAQVEKNNESLWDQNAQPTRRHLALAVWAYSPTPAALDAWLKQERNVKRRKNFRYRMQVGDGPVEDFDCRRRSNGTRSNPWAAVRRLFPKVRSPLFHATRGPRAAQIALHGEGLKLQSGHSHFDGGNAAGISMSRNLDFLLRGGFGNVIFVFDKDVLSKHYRVAPVAYGAGTWEDESEERVYADTLPTSLIAGVLLNYPAMGFEQAEWLGNTHVTYPVAYKSRDGWKAARKKTRRRNGTTGETIACGDCYRWAFRYALEHPDAVLIHGTVAEPMGSPKRIAHAWVVHDGIVKDWQTMEAGYGGKWEGQGYPWPAFQKTWAARPVEEYDYDDVMARMRAFNAYKFRGGAPVLPYGPWDSEGTTVNVMNRKNPMRRSNPQNMEARSDRVIRHLVDRCGMSRAEAIEAVGQHKGETSDKPALTPAGLKVYDAAVKRVIRLPVYKAMFLLLPLTGMRIGEMATLTWDKLDRQKGVWLIVGKNSDIREVPVTKEAWRILDAYEREDRPKDRSDHWVFPRYRGPDHVSTSRAGSAMRALRHDDKRLEALTPHVLRHTFATQKLLECSDMETLRDIMGHRGKRVAEVYFHL